MYKLDNPYWLILLVLPAIVSWRYLGGRAGARLIFAGADDLAGIDRGLRARLSFMPKALRVLILILVVIALARPQLVQGLSRVIGEGIDIVLALDYSTSMLAEDFPPYRFKAAKTVMTEFIDGRKNDRIALVVYAGEAYTQAPLTLDYHLIKEVLTEIDFIAEPMENDPNTLRYTQIGDIPGSTAIGDALVESLARLRDSSAVSKVIILVSDGENNAGLIEPRDAAAVAQKLGVRIYTIGIGGPQPVSWPAGMNRMGGKIYANEKTKLDEGLLKEIAELTAGAYFRATDEEKLREIYRKIDGMEKSEVEMEHYEQVDEFFLYFLLPALLLFGIEIFLRTTLLRSLP
jgi:Ca-activated chloride channel homolog